MYSQFVVVGCGGIGGWLIPPLFKEIEQLRTEIPDPLSVQVLLVDGDKVEQSNIPRQNFTDEHIGGNKAYSFVPDLSGYEYDGSYISEDNVANLIEDSSIVLAGPDNHACRRILAEHCETLKNCCLIIGGNEEFDGNVSCHLRDDGKDVTTPYRSRHPEVWDTTHDDRSEMSCDELSALPGGGQTLAANLMAATIMLNTVRLVLAGCIPLSDVYFDVGESKMGGTA